MSSMINSIVPDSAGENFRKLIRSRSVTLENVKELKEFVDQNVPQTLSSRCLR